jgi:hypothetical protein
MNCGLRHFGNYVIQLSISRANLREFSFNFLKKVVRDQRLSTTPLFVVISPPFTEFRHHFVTFCRFIMSPQTAKICLWISTGCSPFALRNLMTEHTSHLAGRFIDAAISNTSHSNKTGSTSAKWARLRGKGWRSRAVLPHSIQNSPIGTTHAASLLSGHALYNVIVQPKSNFHFM